MKNVLAVFIMLFMLLNSYGQAFQPNTEVDSLKYFDENKRWYNEFTEHWFHFFDIPESDVRDSITQFDKIGKDFQKPENEWEGTYGNGGDTHGNYLRWSEKNGFILLVVNKCNGGPTQIRRGRVVVTGSFVRLIPEKIVTASFHHGNHDETTHKKPLEFLFVKWRGKKFLIESKQIMNFADYTAGLNPETSGFYDENWYFSEVLKETSGSANELPVFPVGYENYVRKPFKGTITALNKNFRRNKPPVAEDAEEYEKEDARNYDELVTEVRLNIGKDSKVAPNVFLRFLPENDDYSADGLRITKVFKDFSIAEYVTDVPKKSCRKSDFERCEAAERRSLKVGMNVSTTGEW
jgi:hypothetical protein